MNEEDYDVSSIDENDLLPVDMVYPVNEETEVPRTDGGLFKTVRIAGTGSLPVKGSKATVHYVGTLLDGTPFDSSRDRGEPFEFTLGRGQVIKGWDVGVATMRVGETAVLRCAPAYAYGAAGSPPTIPPQSTLLFEVELLGWSCEEDISADKDRSLMKQTLVEGTGYDTPDFESTLTIDLAIYLGECHFAESTVANTAVWERKEWTVYGSETPLPPHLLACLQTMHVGEEAGFVVAGRCMPVDGAEDFGIPAASARGQQGSATQCTSDPSWSSSSDRAITYRVHVKEFQLDKAWEFAGEEKIRHGVMRKDKGNAALLRGDLSMAERFYRRALDFIGEDYGMSGELKKACVQARVAVMNNLAQVLLQSSQYTEAVTQLNKVLALDPKNSKALFRLAKAHDGTQSWEDALTVLNRLLEYDSANADAKALRAHIHAEQRAYDAKQKSAFKKLFA